MESENLGVALRLSSWKSDFQEEWMEIEEQELF